MNLRRATMADAGLLLAWRNDRKTREASIDPSEVDAVHHLAWLSAVLDDPDRELLIAENGEDPVGTVRFDGRDGATELSWTVSPHHRHKGYGTKIVEMAVARADGPIKATIRIENAASQKIAGAAGLVLSKTDGDLTVWTNEPA